METSEIEKKYLDAFKMLNLTARATRKEVVNQHANLIKFYTENKGFMTSDEVEINAAAELLIKEYFREKR